MSRFRQATILAGAALALLSSCRSVPQQSARQPQIGVRSKSAITVDGLRFRDANGNGRLDRYEDWRLAPAERVADLVARMSLEQRAGMMLIDTLNSGCGGTTEGTQAAEFVQKQKMTRFILRTTARDVGDSCGEKGTPARNGYTVTPRQLAEFQNAVQSLAEAEPLGIPVLFKDNPRNHYNNDPRFGISGAAGAFTAFPREAGIAAATLGAGDVSPVKALTDVMGAEFRSVGIRGLYGYMADLGTEPRWNRFSETFSENADLNASIMKALVLGLQGGKLSPASSVALTMKHFPGGGPQEQGLDPHYSFGKNQVYPAGRFEDHLKPFKAAINAGVSAIMPYYGVPIGLTDQGVRYDEVGFAFNRQIVTGLLRDRLGFKGYVNSDTGIITDRAWGLESRTVPERIAAAVNAGVDVLSGFNNVSTLTELVGRGLVSEARVIEATRRLLLEQFQLGLFENPYVDAAAADAVIGSAAHRELGMQVQKRSLVLLQNTDRLLPLAKGKRLYTMGMSSDEVRRYGYGVTDGNYTAPATRPSAAGHDAAIIRVQVSNPSAATQAYRTKSPQYGANPSRLNPRTGKTWGAEDPCVTFPQQNDHCIDDRGVAFGGALPWEAGNLSFSAMSTSQSWQITPSLADIRAVMREVGAKHTVLAIYFRQPYVLDAASGLREAGTLLATFGVTDEALLAVVSGQFKPQGKMPFALASTLEAIQNQQSDAPGYAPAETLFPYGFGLHY